MEQNRLQFRTIQNRLDGLKTLKRVPAAPDGYTCAAVVIPLLLVNDRIHILFTKRTGTVRDHQNQISFPGGACDLDDATILDTALREMNEEIGIQIASRAVLGALEPQKTITGYFITPIAARLDSIDGIKVNVGEVEKVILVPLNWLADKRNHECRLYEREGHELYDVIFFSPFEGEIIWGITAEIVLDFIAAIKK